MGVDHLLDILNRYQASRIQGEPDEFLGCQMVSSYINAFLLINVSLSQPVTLFFPPNETMECILDTLIELGLARPTFRLSVFQYQSHVTLEY